MKRKVHVACNFNYVYENEGILYFTASHVHFKGSIISEMVPDTVIHIQSLILMQNTNSK